MPFSLNIASRICAFFCQIHQCAKIGAWGGGPILRMPSSELHYISVFSGCWKYRWSMLRSQCSISTCVTNSRECQDFKSASSHYPSLRNEAVNENEKNSCHQVDWVPQLTCIWVSGESGLGNPTTIKLIGSTLNTEGLRSWQLSCLKPINWLPWWTCCYI